MASLILAFKDREFLFCKIKPEFMLNISKKKNLEKLG